MHCFQIVVITSKEFLHFHFASFSLPPCSRTQTLYYASQHEDISKNSVYSYFAHIPYVPVCILHIAKAVLANLLGLTQTIAEISQVNESFTREQ